MERFETLVCALRVLTVWVDYPIENGKMRKTLRIAEVVLAIESHGLQWEFRPEISYRHFEVDNRTEDVRVDVHWHPYVRTDLGEEVFCLVQDPTQPHPDCSLYHDSTGQWILEVNSGGTIGGNHLYRRRVAVFEPDFSRGDLYVDLARRDIPANHYPLWPPLDRVLFVNLMSRRRGMLVHACGIVLNGQGYVFAGPSGSGKTTLAACGPNKRASRYWERSA